MHYPFWDTSLGYGQLMGLIAVLHVFISHFAIGGGFYLVISELSARKKNNHHRLQFLERLSKFFVLVTLVSGALTGVGIWFIIGLLNPAAIEVLIHHFIWAWGIEWTLFVVEITAAILYYYGWKHLDPRSHLILGWIYFITAWLSLFAINGIVTFMLTPGDWLSTGDFFDGFFNPTFWPSFVFRSGLSIMLAGLFTLLLTPWHGERESRSSLVRLNTIWALVGLMIMVPSFFWYQLAIPNDLMQRALASMSIPFEAINEGAVYAAVLAVLLVLTGLVLPRKFHLVTASVLMLLGLMLFGNFEWWRESLRKPYVISGYMYGNSAEVALAAEYQQNGYLASIDFRTGDDGADLFRHTCRSCHTIDGYRPLKPALDGTDEEFVAGRIRGLHTARGNMPPFMGSEKEIKMLASHIYSRLDHRPLAEIYSLSGIGLGRKVYEIRCGGCHQFGGLNDIFESLVDLDEEEYNDLLDGAGDIAVEMPSFTASDEERRALILYLMTLTEEDDDVSAKL